MHPKFDEFFRILEFSWISEQQTLENTRKMTQVELIVEVKCSLSEWSHNVLMESQSRSNDKRSQLLESRFESFEMTL